MKLDLAKLLEGVEQALNDWNVSPTSGSVQGALAAAVDVYLFAIHAARESGAVPVLLSREAVEALRRAREADPATWSDDRHANAMIAHDLGDVLK